MFGLEKYCECCLNSVWFTFTVRCSWCRQRCAVRDWLLGFLNRAFAFEFYFIHFAIFHWVQHVVRMEWLFQSTFTFAFSPAKMERCACNVFVRVCVSMSGASPVPCSPRNMKERAKIHTTICLLSYFALLLPSPLAHFNHKRGRVIYTAKISIITTTTPTAGRRKIQDVK